MTFKLFFPFAPLLMVKKSNWDARSFFSGSGSLHERLQYLFLKHCSSTECPFPFNGSNSHSSIQAQNTALVLHLISSCGATSRENKVDLGWWCQNLHHSKTILQLHLLSNPVCYFLVCGAQQYTCFFAT